MIIYFSCIVVYSISFPACHHECSGQERCLYTKTVAQCSTANLLSWLQVWMPLTQSTYIVCTTTGQRSHCLVFLWLWLVMWMITEFYCSLVFATPLCCAIFPQQRYVHTHTQWMSIANKLQSSCNTPYKCLCSIVQYLCLTSSQNCESHWREGMSVKYTSIKVSRLYQTSSTCSSVWHSAIYNIILMLF